MMGETSGKEADATASSSSHDNASMQWALWASNSLGKILKSDWSEI
jgi:hypothetical protein